MIKVAYVGSRGRDDSNTSNQIEITLDYIYFAVGQDGFTIVSGGAKGVDTIAVALAKKLYIKTIEHIPKWRNDDGTYNKGAGYQRNWQVIDMADIIIAFWDGSSKGTLHVIDNAKKRGKRTFVFLPTDEIDGVTLNDLISAIREYKS